MKQMFYKNENNNIHQLGKEILPALTKFVVKKNNMHPININNEGILKSEIIFVCSWKLSFLTILYYLLFIDRKSVV